MTTINVKIGEWIELKDDHLLEIISGEVELYVVYKSVRRVFLCEEKTGGFLCGIPHEIDAPELSFVAIATKETTLRPMTRDELYSSDRTLKVEALEDSLSTFFCRPDHRLLPRVCRELLPGERAELPAGTRIAAPKGHPTAAQRYDAIRRYGKRRPI